MKKIMFNDKYGLTKAVLEGRKTMTRRVVPEKMQEAYYDYDDYVNAVAPRDIPCSREYEKEFFLRRSPFKAGEVVAVAQAYRDAINPLDWVNTLIYKNEPGWTNKMFVGAELMPHQIFINAVRVERLQDISDENCLREGIVKDDSKTYFNGYAFDYSFDKHGNILASRWYKTPRDAFAALIAKVSGKEIWESNPWVFVYEFQLVKKDEK